VQLRSTFQVPVAGWRAVSVSPSLTLRVGVAMVAPYVHLGEKPGQIFENILGELGTRLDGEERLTRMLEFGP